MGLFGKSDNLSPTLKRIETETKLMPSELAPLLDLAAANPEFQLEKNLWMFTHPNAKVREFAAGQFTANVTPALADALIRELPGKLPAVRMEMAKLVVASAPDRVAAQLGPLVHSAKVEQREAALDLIGQTSRWQDYLGHLKAAARDATPQVRQRAVRILSRGMDNQTIVFILRELLHDEDAGVRRLVIQAFSEKPSPDLVEPFFERLALEEAQERDVMIRALSHLAKNCQAQVEDRLLPMLGDENPEMREAAVRLLGQMPDQTRVLRAFLLHCRGLAFWLRERSIQSLLKISNDLVEPLLALMRDEDGDVRVGAMMLARGVKDPRVAAPIRDIFLSQADWWIRSMAAEVLGTMNEPGVTDLLISKIKDPELEYSIVAVLGKSDAPRAQEALRRSLAEGNPGIRRASLTALAARKTPEAMQVIARSAQEDPDAAVRARAVELLEAFGDSSRGILDAIEARDREVLQARKGEAVELEMVNGALNAS